MSTERTSKLDAIAGVVAVAIDEWDDSTPGTLTAHVATHVTNRLEEQGLLR